MLSTCSSISPPQQRPPWFEQLLLPVSRYAHMKPIYVDIATGTWEENFQKLFQVVKLYGDRCLCLAVADIAMNLYSAVLETLKQRYISVSG